MNYCELISSITALAAIIANNVPKEELPLLSAFFAQLASTLVTISVEFDLADEAAKKKEEQQGGQPVPPVPPFEQAPIPIAEPIPIEDIFPPVF